jgi:hypothetical protein
MRSPATWLLAALLAEAIPGSLAAQWRPLPGGVESSTPEALFEVLPVRDSLTAAPIPPRKSPTTAVLLSAALPGAGQFYNESYWKVPIVVGLGGYFVVEFLHNNTLYKQYRDEYEASIGLLPGSSGDETALRFREFYKDQRNEFAFYFLILYFVNLVDAYVDAVLFDFDMSDDLSLRTLPGSSLSVHVFF